MVNDGCDPTEKPLVRAVIEEENPLAGLATLPQSAPATRDKSSRTSELQGLHYRVCQGLGIVDNDTPKANVYWLRAIRQESCQIFRWFVSGRVSEEEAAYI